MNDHDTDAFAQSSHYFADLVAETPRDALTAPGLGSWTVLELVAHANRAHTTVEDYLLHPQPPEPPDSPYFVPEAIAARARDAVAALGDDPAATVRATSQRVVALVAGTAGSALLGSPAGTQTLAEYLPSRIAELVIHGLDLADALQLDRPPPVDAAAAATRFVAGRAAHSDAGTVLRALTGRGVLPHGFTVY